MSPQLTKSLAVVALAIGPLTVIATNIAQLALAPSVDGSTPADVAEQFPRAWLALGLLAVFGPLVWLLGLPAIDGLAVGRKGGRATRIGVVLSAVGLAAGVGHLAIYFGTFAVIASARVGTQSTGALTQAADRESLGNALLVVFLACYSVGPVVLAVGLRVARRVAVWVPVAMILTAGANLFGGPVAGIVQLVALAAAWGAIGLAVARDEGRAAADQWISLRMQV